MLSLRTQSILKTQLNANGLNVYQKRQILPAHRDVLLMYHINTASEKGFTLIELMIALLIGLIVIAGAAFAYSTIQQTLIKKLSIDAEQDALRFLSTRVASLVRSSNGIKLDEKGNLFLMTQFVDALCLADDANIVGLSFDDGSVNCLNDNSSIVKNLPWLDGHDAINLIEVDDKAYAVKLNFKSQLTHQKMTVLLSTRQSNIE